MDKRFYSKKDWWIWGLFGGIIIIDSIEIIIDILNKPTIATIMDILIVAVISWLLFGTYYEFKEDYLFVKSGPIKEKFYYNNITKINSTKSLLASTALSTDRIEIIYRGRLGGYISPKNKEEFIEILKEKCLHENL